MTKVSADVARQDDGWEGPLAVEGGDAVRQEPWKAYDNGHAAFADSDVDAGIRAMRSGRLFRYDDRDHGATEAGAFETALEAYFDCQHALGCASGTTAIALGLMALGIGPGDTVLCPAFTFSATPSAVLLAGAQVRIVDVDSDLHMDVDDLRAKLTPDVRAVIVVHMRGFASDIEQIAQITDDAGVWLVEDAVPSLGVSVGGRKLGTFGAVGAFSTQSDKTLNTGEGGFLLTDESRVFARAVVLSGAHEGRFGRHLVHDEPADFDLRLPMYSFRLDEVRAAVARNQLKRLDEHVRQQQSIYMRVVDAVADIGGVRLRTPVAPAAFLGESLNFRMVDAEPEEVEWAAKALRAEGISARALGSPSNPNARVFWNWLFAFPGMSSEEIAAMNPNSARRLREVIDIPLASSMTDVDCQDLITSMRRVLRRRVPAPTGSEGRARP